MKKIDKDPCIINLILRELQDQKEVWIADDGQLRDHIEDCTVCEFFSRLHKKIIDKLLEVTNDLIDVMGFRCLFKQFEDPRHMVPFDVKKTKKNPLLSLPFYNYIYQ